MKYTVVSILALLLIAFVGFALKSSKEDNTNASSAPASSSQDDGSFKGLGK